MKSKHIYLTYNHSLAICEALGFEMLYDAAYSDQNISDIGDSVQTSVSNVSLGTKWINDGISETYIPKADNVPEGWKQGRLGKHGGKRGEYNKTRYEKITKSRKETIERIGNKNIGLKRSDEFKELMSSIALTPAGIEKANKNLQWNNFRCCCVVCKKETSNTWFKRSHKDCILLAK